MSLREAAQQALEALELAGMSHDVMLMSDPPQDAWKARSVSWKVAQAMIALRSALAEDVPETMPQPVAYVTGFTKGRCTIQLVDPAWLPPVGMALYRSPPTCQESRQVEPVAWRYIPSERLRDVVLTSDPSQARLAADYGCEVQPLYPAPPKREPLSGIEIQQIELKLRQYSDYDKYDLSLHDFARAVERAHGIGGEK